MTRGEGERCLLLYHGTPSLNTPLPFEPIRWLVGDLVQLADQPMFGMGRVVEVKRGGHYVISSLSDGAQMRVHGAARLLPAAGSDAAAASSF